MAQSLGMMPKWLQKVAYESDKIGHLEWKYVLLVAVLAARGILQHMIDRAAEARIRRAQSTVAGSPLASRFASTN